MTNIPRAPSERPPMTRIDQLRAQMLRRAGMPLDQIAKHLHQNIRRISEAINGKRKGV